MNPGTKKLLTTVGAIIVALVVWWLEQGKQPQGDSKGGDRGRQSRSAPSEGRGSGTSADPGASIGGANRELIAAWKAGQEKKWVTGTGRVLRTLRDDTHGSKHQKFVLGIAENLEVVVAHNIDIADRVPVQRGTEVEYHGRFEYEAPQERHPDHGGVLHWTHRDPGGRHAGGWLKVKGKTYR